MTTKPPTKAVARPMDQLKNLLSAASVREQFDNALKDNSNLFIASVIDLFGSSPELQACDPGRLVAECLKAATLKLPINRNLGFAWIVPYRIKGVPTPQFQVGYKGYIQLALRTGQYRYINAGLIHEGIEVKRDILTGMVAFDGESTSDKAQGYFAYIETLNGFKKTVYMTKAEVERHGQRYSRAYDNEASRWQLDFDAMAMKTCLRMLLSKYGAMSIDMAQVFSYDDEAHEEAIASEIEAEATSKPLIEGPKAEAGKPEPTQQPARHSEGTSEQSLAGPSW
jgi:recombination protein RecT